MLRAVEQADPHADVSALEAEINQLVYSLYGLTREEDGFVLTVYLTGKPASLRKVIWKP